jgi:hypothetical protein
MTVKEMASLGGKARAERMSKDAQSANGRKAAAARWGKVMPKKKREKALTP